MRNCNYLVLLVAFMSFANLSIAQTLIPTKTEKGKIIYVDASGNQMIKTEYDDGGKFENGKAKVCKSGKWGYIDPNGKEVIKLIYTRMYNWENGCCKVAVGGEDKDGVLKGVKFGFISSDGTYLLKPKYSDIRDFVDGLALVQDGAKNGFIDKQFKEVIPCQFTGIGFPNKQGFIWVNKGGKMVKDGYLAGGSFGIYNKNGDVVVPAKYKYIGQYLTAIGSKYEMIPWVLYPKMKPYEKLEDTPYKYFVADNSMRTSKDVVYPVTAKPMLFDEFGKVIYKGNKYNSIACPQEGMISVFTDPTKDEVGMNYIDMSTGNTIYKTDVLYTKKDNPDFKKDSISHFLYAQYADTLGKRTVTNLYPYSMNRCCAMFRNSFFPQSFCNGVAKIILKGKNYLINKSGGMVGEYYDKIDPFYNKNVAVVKKDDKYGLIDNKGSLVTPMKYSFLRIERPIPEMGLEGSSFIEARDAVTGNYGYINEKGETVIPFDYMNGSCFIYGWAKVQGPNGWGYINEHNKSIIQCRWKNIQELDAPNSKYIWAMNYGDKWTCVDVATDKPRFEQTFNTVYNYTDKDVAFVVNPEKKIGAIDENGNFLIPAIISDDATMMKAYAKLLKNDKKPWNEFDTFKFSLQNSGKCNSYKLSDKIDEDMWDY